MRRRAFCPDLSHASVTVDDAEAHHLLHVLRVRVGDRVEVFDGMGQEATGNVTAVNRRDVVVAIEERRSSIVSENTSLSVFCSPPKGERLKWLVEKLTEIGVDRLTLLGTQRTIVEPGETKLDRLRAAVISACKQCLRNRLMQVEPLTPMSQLLAGWDRSDRPLRLIAHPGENARTLLAVLTTTERTRPIELLIGPEGGFTDDEVNHAVRNGAVAVKWPGENILRIETAALVIASVVIHDRR